MPQTSRIPTPLKQHLLRFRLGVLPAVAFGFCVLLTLWLWDRQATPGSVVGEVEAYQVDVAAGVEGQLLASQEPYWRLYDTVAKGQTIARIDDKDVQAQVAVIQAEIGKLQNDLDAARTEFELERANLAQGDQRRQIELMWEIERRDLETARLLAEQEGLAAEISALNARIKELEPFIQQAGAPTGPLNELKRQRDVLLGQGKAAQKVRVKLQGQLERLREEQQQLPPLDIPELDGLLAPIRAEIEVQDALIRQLEVQRENLIITAPFDGVITAIHRWPGQRLMPGDPIVTLARPDAGYVIGYVRENQQVQLYKGMKVALRVGTKPGSEEFLSAVETIGPQVAPTPQHQWADQNAVERATPIKIPIPPELRQQQLRPGQLVHVIFQEPRRQAQ